MSTLKHFKIKNCPAIQVCDCANTICIWKQAALLKPKNRIEYIKNKLSSCYGYSEEQKQIRYQELHWCLKETSHLLEVEMLDEDS